MVVELEVALRYSKWLLAVWPSQARSAPFYLADYWIALAVVAGITLQKYYSTAHQTIAGETPWLPHTILWPQILALVLAIILIILNAIVLFGYFWGTKVADQMSDWRDRLVTYFPQFLDVLHTVFPMSVAISMFVSANNANSLQNQSCADPPPALFPHIQFSGICTMQVHSTVHDVLIVGVHWVYVACSRCGRLFGWLDLRLELGWRETQEQNEKAWGGGTQISYIWESYSACW